MFRVVLCVKDDGEGGWRQKELFKMQIKITNYANASRSSTEWKSINRYLCNLFRITQTVFCACPSKGWPVGVGKSVFIKAAGQCLMLLISKIVLRWTPGAEAGNSITQSLSKYIFMRLNYSLLSVDSSNLTMTMPYAFALCSRFSYSNIAPFIRLKIELICKFMCILLFHPYLLMLLASLLMDFLNQFNA